MLEEGRSRHIAAAAAALKHTAEHTASRTPEGMLRGALGPYGIFFSGVGPRVTWISIGGFVFFGAYEKAKDVLIGTIWNLVLLLNAFNAVNQAMQLSTYFQ